MRHDVSIPFLGLALTALALPVQAQEASPDSLPVAVAALVLQSDLRNYVRVQEMFFADHNAFAAMAEATDLVLSRGVTVVLLTSSERGHSAVAIHSAAPGLVCGIWVGAEPAPPLRDGASEGRPTCRIPDPAPI